MPRCREPARVDRVNSQRLGLWLGVLLGAIGLEAGILGLLYDDWRSPARAITVALLLLGTFVVHGLLAARVVGSRRTAALLVVGNCIAALVAAASVTTIAVIVVDDVAEDPMTAIVPLFIGIFTAPFMFYLAVGALINMWITRRYRPGTSRSAIPVPPAGSVPPH